MHTFLYSDVKCSHIEKSADSSSLDLAHFELCLQLILSEFLQFLFAVSLSFLLAFLVYVSIWHILFMYCFANV